MLAPPSLYIGLAVVVGVDRERLNSLADIEAALRAAAVAAEFSIFDVRVVAFPIEGITGCAIVGESHIAIHTWPTEGRLFIDVASCTHRRSVETVIVRVAALLGGVVETEEHRVLPLCPRATETV